MDRSAYPSTMRSAQNKLKKTGSKAHEIDKGKQEAATGRRQTAGEAIGKQLEYVEPDSCFNKIFPIVIPKTKKNYPKKRALRDSDEEQEVDDEAGNE